jgi:hypothetical protein
MPTARQKAASLMGQSKSPAKVAAARENARKATAARKAAAALRRAQKAAQTPEKG